MSLFSLQRSQGLSRGALAHFSALLTLDFRATRACRILIPVAQSLHMSSPLLATVIEKDEKAQFTHYAPHWWDPQGPLRILHTMNGLRVPFIRDGICLSDTPASPTGLPPGCYAPLFGRKILDVGCGGGILSEPLAVLGADVLGIDQVEESIAVAAEHADLTTRYSPSPVFRPPQYRLATLQDITHESAELFDAIVLSEVLEHVTEWEDMLQQASVCLKPGGMLFITTINRTLPSFLVAIVGAEYLTKTIPRGTHHWSKFIEPDRVYAAVTKIGLQMQQLLGMRCNPLTGRWSWTNNLCISYALSAAKPVHH